MSSQETESDRDLAAEYVLGVLTASDRQLVAQRCAVDAAFAREVSAWELRLAPLAEGIPAYPPPASVWTRIEGALDFSAAAQPRAAQAGIRLWERIAFWRWLSAGALAAAAASLAALVIVPRIDDMPLTLVATLASDDGTPAFTTALDPRSETMIVTPVRTFGLAQQAHELWIVPRDGTPVALAVFSREGVQRVTLRGKVTAAIAASATLAVSLEPVGGSPTGQPTGPVVAHGALQKL